MRNGVSAWRCAAPRSRSHARQMLKSTHVAQCQRTRRISRAQAAQLMPSDSARGTWRWYSSITVECFARRSESNW